MICYSTLAKDNNSYYEISAGGEILPYSQDSPIVRGNSERIKGDIEKYKDETIYIAFYNQAEQQDVFKNLDSMVKTGKLKIIKFSKKELDSMDWQITYSDK